jgi:putative transposase
MQIGNQFRCYPDTAQAHILLQWIGCQRHIYNAKVREDRYFRSFAKKSLNHVGQYAPIDQQYSHFKSELTPFLSEVPSQVLRNGASKWKEAYSRYFGNLGGRPTLQNKHGKQSVWLTSELFNFSPVMDVDTGEIKSYALNIGTKKYPIGTIKFKAHKPYKIPNSIHLSIHAGCWFLSFNYDDKIPEPTQQEVVDYLMQFSQQELDSMTVGLDRGVNIPLADSAGNQFGFSHIQLKRLAKAEKYKKRWQRKQARRTKGSIGYCKSKQRIAKIQQYVANIRGDVAHKISYTLATNPQLNMFVFEDLKVKNMTKKAKPKQDANGKFIRNGASAKSGLNKSILESVWGKTKTFTQYKAIRKGKLVVSVPPAYSSQECAQCGYIHQDNRNESRFVCLRCGNQDHADINAAQVIKSRGIKMLLNGEVIEKKKKRCGIKKQVGRECTEPIVEIQSKPIETKVNRKSVKTDMYWSLMSETPTRRPLGL